MTDWLDRERLLLKDEGIAQLQKANVLVVGLGGVGAMASEFIARAGIGNMTIVDGDVVSLTNINRQLPALHSTLGMPKVEVVGTRLLDINPTLQLTQYNEFMTPERTKELVTDNFNFVVDCIDSITPKLQLIVETLKRQIPLVSSMGAGGKLKADKVQVADISKTYNCMMARIIRKRLRHLGIHKGFPAVFSSELPISESLALTDGSDYKKSYYGTISYMPALFGLYLAETIIDGLVSQP